MATAGKRKRTESKKPGKGGDQAEEPQIQQPDALSVSESRGLKTSHVAASGPGGLVGQDPAGEAARAMIMAQQFWQMQAAAAAAGATFMPRRPGTWMPLLPVGMPAAGMPISSALSSQALQPPGPASSSSSNMRPGKETSEPASSETAQTSTNVPGDSAKSLAGLSKYSEGSSSSAELGGAGLSSSDKALVKAVASGSSLDLRSPGSSSAPLPMAPPLSALRSQATVGSSTWSSIMNTAPLNSGSLGSFGFNSGSTSALAPSGSFPLASSGSGPMPTDVPPIQPPTLSELRAAAEAAAAASEASSGVSPAAPTLFSPSWEIIGESPVSAGSLGSLGSTSERLRGISMPGGLGRSSASPQNLGQGPSPVGMDGIGNGTFAHSFGRGSFGSCSFDLDETNALLNQSGSSFQGSPTSLLPRASPQSPLDALALVGSASHLAEQAKAAEALENQKRLRDAAQGKAHGKAHDKTQQGTAKKAAGGKTSGSPVSRSEAAAARKGAARKGGEGRRSSGGAPSAGRRGGAARASAAKKKEAASKALGGKSDDDSDSEENRGKYRCGRCGKYKVNHVCAFIADAACRDVGIQADPTAVWAAKNLRIVTVRSRGYGLKLGLAPKPPPPTPAPPRSGLAARTRGATRSARRQQEHGQEEAAEAPTAPGGLPHQAFAPAPLGRLGSLSPSGGLSPSSGLSPNSGPIRLHGIATLEQIQAAQAIMDQHAWQDPAKGGSGEV
eukprot:CAMPEP_0172586330 /NCGR_PEP_ID=MMETSP1068-20121228/5707_1 /TAXON_ID=35684 /ORGANISM="Pseudopedinella elastica, Strain CCMP716" /LENGTH=727 /DNA_ID=CAMNT_0013381091 /DNA_START=78 /DNA_END=2261 /DNA_ORIENTATION=-